MAHVLISPEEVARSFEHFVVLDARGGTDAKDRFERDHIEGSLRVDLDRDLAAHVDDAAFGGRHPLPPIEDFARLIGSLGIDAEARIAVVDDQGGANAAARLVWMLRAAGIRESYLVDGALAGLKPLVLGRSPRARSSSNLTISASAWGAPLATLDDVQARRLDPRWRVVDVRSAPRYRGETESVDPVAGHIPGAINLPFADNLDERGRFKPLEALRSLYGEKLDVPMDHVIVHCGSGVTACHTLLVLEELGMSGAALYVGSWSEWCRRPELPREPKPLG